MLSPTISFSPFDGTFALRNEVYTSPFTSGSHGGGPSTHPNHSGTDLKNKNNINARDFVDNDMMGSYLFGYQSYKHHNVRMTL